MAPKAKYMSDEDLNNVTDRIINAYDKKRQDAQQGKGAAKVPRVLVGIAGRPGGGKTTIAVVIAAAVKARLSGYDNPAEPGTKGVEVCVMPMDGYHLYRKELHAMPNPKEAVARRGAEWTFNPKKLNADLTKIRTPNAEGSYDDVFVPAYIHGVGDPKENAIRIPRSAGVIIVEGNYLLYRGKPEWAAVNSNFDVTVFLKCSRETCIERICRRHMKAWKVSREQAMVRAKGNDAINGDLVDTTMGNADVVVTSVEVPESKL